MKNPSSIVRLMAVLSLLFYGLVAVPGASAQTQEFEPDAYTSQLSGYDVEISTTDFEITDARLQHYSNGEGEVLDLEGDGVFLEISFFDDGDTPDDSIDAYLTSVEEGTSSFEVIDRNTVGDTTYALVVMVYEGTDLVYYVQVTEDVTGNVDLFESALLLLDWVEHDIALAQDVVTIDGQPFMADVDAAAVQEAAATGAPIGEGTGDDTSSPVADETVEATEEVDSVEGSSYAFEIASVELEASGDFTIDPETEVSTSEELVFIESPISITSLTLLETTETDPEALLADYSGAISETLDTYEEVDGGSDSESAWHLLTGSYDGNDATMLAQVRFDMVDGFAVVEIHAFIGTDIESVITGLQTDVTLDGQGLASTVNAAEAQALLDGETVDPNTTETGTDTTTNPRDGAKLPDLDGTAEPDGDATEESTSEQPGNLTDSSWTGDIHGVEISWDSASWDVDYEDEEPLVSNQDLEYDQIILTRQGTSFLSVDVVAADGLTAADYMEYWLSADYTDVALSEGHELLLSRNRGEGASVIYRDSVDSGAQFILVREAYQLDEDTLVLVMYFALPDTVAEGYGELRETLLADGTNVVTVFNVNQIERALRN